MRILPGITLVCASVMLSNCGNQVPDRDRQILVAEARQGSNATVKPPATPATTGTTTGSTGTISPVSTSPTTGTGTTPSPTPAPGGVMLTCAQSFSQNLAPDLATCAGCHSTGQGGLTLIADADADNLATIQAEGFSLFIDKVGPTANATHASFATFEAKFKTVDGDCT